MTESSEEEHEVYGRNNYQSRAHKLATLFLMTAGSANATQFPLMFIVYGGTPFLLAYLVFLGTVAFPMMRLESNLAQFSGDGNRGIFSAVPLFIGLGYTMSLYAIVHIVGDSVPVSDLLLYLLASLRNVTAWSDCPHPGMLASNRTCYPPHRHGFTLCKTARARLADAFRRQTLSQGVPTVGTGEHMQVVLVPPKVYQHEISGCLPAVHGYLQQYHLRRQQADWSASSLTHIRAQPLLSLAAVWMLVFAIAHKGFTTVKRFLYAMLGIHLATSCLLLIRGVTLPGALGGLRMLLYADWSYGINLEMWSNALYVSLESVGVTGSIYLGIVRFNNFKNKYQQDVNFVLVADTASKGIRTAITFMFLGHLASTIGVDVRMLVHMESNFVVGIMPQAMSVVPYHQLWSHVHSLWLLSTMLPKFLIVPDIVIEVLSPVNPFFFLNRTLVHFFVCVSLLLASIVVCTPGGANIAAMIVHNHDQNLRFVVLFLESVVLLQYCGIRRLDIICRMMTGRECTAFVKICLASLIPVIVICLFLAEVAYPHSKESHDPLWIDGLMTWFDLVQLSCIAVFAVVLMNETGMTFENCLLPLPTWLPASWEKGMLYRHMMAEEGIDPAPPLPTPPPTETAKKSRPSSSTSSSSSSSDTSSSTEFMATHLVVASDPCFAIPGQDDGREPGGRSVPTPGAPTSDWPQQQQRKGDPTAPGATRSARSIGEGRLSTTVDPGSSTLHVSRHLSSVRRSMMRQRQRDLRRASQAAPNHPSKEQLPKEHASLEVPAPGPAILDQQRVDDVLVDQKSVPTIKPPREISSGSAAGTMPKAVKMSHSSARLPEPKPPSTGSSRKGGEKLSSKRQAHPVSEQVLPLPPVQDNPDDVKPVKSKRKKEHEAHKREHLVHKAKEPRAGRPETGPSPPDLRQQRRRSSASNPVEPVVAATPPSGSKRPPGQQASAEKRHPLKPSGPSPKSQHVKHRKPKSPTDKEASKHRKANIFKLMGMALSPLSDSPQRVAVPAQPAAPTAEKVATDAVAKGAVKSADAPPELGLERAPQVGSKPTNAEPKTDKNADIAWRPASAIGQDAIPGNVQPVAEDLPVGAAQERVENERDADGRPPPADSKLPPSKKGSEASLRTLAESIARVLAMVQPEEQGLEKHAGTEHSQEPLKPPSLPSKRGSAASAKSLAAEIMLNLELEPSPAKVVADQGAAVTARDGPEVVNGAPHDKKALRKQQRQDEPKAPASAKSKKPRSSQRNRKHHKGAGSRDGASPSAHNVPRNVVPTAGLDDPTQKKPPEK